METKKPTKPGNNPCAEDGSKSCVTKLRDALRAIYYGEPAILSRIEWMQSMAPVKFYLNGCYTQCETGSIVDYEPVFGTIEFSVKQESGQEVSVFLEELSTASLYGMMGSIVDDVCWMIMYDTLSTLSNDDIITVNNTLPGHDCLIARNDPAATGTNTTYVVVSTESVLMFCNDAFDAIDLVTTTDRAMKDVNIVERYIPERFRHLFDL